MGIASASPLKTRGTGRDFFQTPEVCVQALVDRSALWHEERILDPSAGNGPISKVLRRNGFDFVDEFDIHPSPGKDFLKDEYEHYDVVVCNPPYSKKNDFIRRALSIADRIYMILPMQVVNYNQFHREFLAIPQYQGRILMTPKFFMTEEYQIRLDHRGGISSYAWFCWQPAVKFRPRSWEVYVDLDEIEVML
jgi:hypothetical protein